MRRFAPIRTALALSTLAVIQACGGALPVSVPEPETSGPEPEAAPFELAAFAAHCPDVTPDPTAHPVTNLVTLHLDTGDTCDAAAAYGIRAATWLKAYRLGHDIPDITFVPWSVAAALPLRGDGEPWPLPDTTARLAPSPIEPDFAWGHDQYRAALVEAPVTWSAMLDAFDDLNETLPVVPMTIEPDSEASVSGLSWVMGRRLAGAAGSGFRSTRIEDTARALASDGVTKVISLTQWVVNSDMLDAHGLSHVRIPVQDFTAPTQDQIATLVHEVNETFAEGGAVVIHCSAGKGRTGTMLSAYFVSQGMTADEALAHVRSLRPGSVETESQEQAIHTFAASLGHVPDPAP